MTEALENVARFLQSFEEQLLDQTVRNNPDLVSSLLAEDFVEFGTSGGIYNKQDIVDALASESVNEDTPILSASEFAVRTLADDVMQITYRSVRTFQKTEQKRHSLRCSIWKYIDGRWQMVFHQGTPTAAI